MSRLDPAARVRRHIEEILAEGPVSFDAVRSALLARGLDLGPRPDERLDGVLEDMARVDWLQVDPSDDADDPIDLCFDRLAVIGGTTWTVRVGDVDLDSGTLSTDSLGLLFVALINEWCVLDGAAEIGIDLEGRRLAVAERLGVHCGGGVVLPPGWLAGTGVRVGGFLSLRLDGEVVHAIAADKVPEPDAGLAEALAGVVASEPAWGGSWRVVDALTELFVAHPEFRGVVLPPLADWIDAAGLVRAGNDIAVAGFDFERERLRRRLEDVVESRQLGESDAQAFATVLAVWARWSAEQQEVEPDLLAEAARGLGSVKVLTAFVDEECDPEAPDEMVAFGEALIDAATGPRRAGPAWLVAQAFGRAGMTDGFETWIDTALGFDGDFLLALYDKAWFEFDRGEARRAKLLLSRLGGEMVDHDVEILDSVLVTTRPAAGRNDPCPCGSGRKYKRCHLGVDEVPLDARLTWLYRKANWWLEYRHRAEVEVAAFLRATNSELSPGRMLELDPLVADSVLTEGGRFAEWLSERGALLPSDEALLAAQWALVQRSVFEVTDVRLDDGLTLRDVRTGDAVEVTERRGTHDMDPGRFILARPLPTEEGAHQFFGGITIVPDAMLERFIEVLDDDPTPAQIMTLVADCEAPPKVANSDGHATVFCETTWRVADVDTAAAALDGAFQRSDEHDSWTWLDDAGNGDEDGSAAGRTVFGTLAMCGDELAVSTNSVERAEAAARLIEALLPGAVLVEDLRSDIDEVRGDLAYERSVFGDGDEPPSGLIDPSNAPPEVRAALREQMNRYEDAWVNESIPALGGLTPRQALDDPTRRDDVFRLLDRMDEADTAMSAERQAFGMRSSRLRDLLGLPPATEQPIA